MRKMFGVGWLFYFALVALDFSSAKLQIATFNEQFKKTHKLLTADISTSNFIISSTVD